jgi:hypothetical protein
MLHHHDVRILDCQDDVSVELWELTGTPTNWEDGNRIPVDSHDHDDSPALSRIERRLKGTNLLPAAILIVSLIFLVWSFRRS